MRVFRGAKDRWFLVGGEVVRWINSDRKPVPVACEAGNERSEEDLSVRDSLADW